MSILPQTYYVYLLVRPNGIPFYVGKGKGRRIDCHEVEARSGHRCHKCNVIRKIWKNGGEVGRVVWLETDDGSAAFACERELILLYGRKNLTNQTDGGEGASGPSEETQAKRRASLMGRPVSPETREKIRRANLGNQSAKGAVRSPETRRKMSEAQRGNKNSLGVYRSEETRRRMSEAQKGRSVTDEFRAKMRAANLGRKQSDEHRRNISEGLKNSARYRKKPNP